MPGRSFGGSQPGTPSSAVVISAEKMTPKQLARSEEKRKKVEALAKEKEERKKRRLDAKAQKDERKRLDQQHKELLRSLREQEKKEKETEKQRKKAEKEKMQNKLEVLKPCESGEQESQEDEFKFVEWKGGVGGSGSVTGGSGGGAVCGGGERDRDTDSLRGIIIGRVHKRKII